MTNNEMSTETVNLAGAKWIDNGRQATFAASRPGFGVKREDGKVLSRNGVAPCAWRTKKAADMVAPYAHGLKAHTWIDLI